MSDINSLDDFLLLLKGVKLVRDGQYLALCPGHHDTKPSLSVKEADGTILLKCFSGCDLADILKPLNLSPKDLFLNSHKSKPEHREIEAICHYDGFEVVRTRPKGFYQRRPDGKGGYINNLKGITPTLYHADELPEAIVAGNTIFIAEGEKDVDRLRAEGFTATCNPMGAGKWRDSYSKALKGADVVIIPDNDGPGRAHAAQVARSCYGKAARIRVLELPDAKDASEWLDDGHTAGELTQLASQCPEYEPPADTALPEIVVTDRHLRDQTTDVLKALYKANDPPHIFRRSGALTRIGTDEKGRPFTEILSEAALRGKLARAANFVRTTERGEAPISPPLDVTRDIESLGAWDFPPLVGITEAPVLRRDGTVLTQTGYDAATGLYYVPAPGLVVPLIPEAPTDAELQASIELVLEVLCDFPFDSLASRDNGYGALIAPVIRPAIEGPAPFPAIDKPQPGCGASLKADVISIIATGHLAATMGVPQSEEEWEKKLSSHLLAGRSLCVIDNIEGKLYSDTLSRYLTSTHVSIRPLGRSADIILVNNMTFIATGNNIRLGGDMPRRCYWVRLDAGVARPWLREVKFKHPELREWVFANRGAILAAILTIAQGWIATGRPVPDGLPMLGGFEGYCRTIGGILEFMGISGFLDNLFQMYDKMDADTPQWEGFLEMWREVIGEVQVTVAELIKHLNESEDFAATLPDSLATWNGRDYSRRMGNALSKRQNVRLPNGLMVIKAGERKHAKTWAAVSYQNANSPIFSYKSELGELTDTPAHKRSNDIFSYKNGVENNSLNSPLGTKQGELASSGNQKHIEEAIQLPIETIIDLWEYADKPAIELRPGEKAKDLVKLFESENLRDTDIEAVRVWVMTQFNKPEGGSGQ